MRPRLDQKFGPGFWFLVFEALSGGFFVSISRSLLPILLVNTGYSLQDILAINALSGLMALIASKIIHVKVRPGKAKTRLLIVHIMERLLWFSIPFVAAFPSILPVMVGFAWTSSFMTGIYLNALFFTSFEREKYRRLIGYRMIAGSVSSIIGQLVLVIILAAIKSYTRYLILYTLAFLGGLAGTVLIALSQATPILERPRRSTEEVEIRATSTLLMLVMLFTVTNLISIAWVPRLMKQLHAPDYFVGLIWLVQTFSNIFASMFWSKLDMKLYRYAIIGLSLTPILIILLNYPLIHLGIAILYSFSLVGTNLFAGLAYSNIVKKLGIVRASIMLTAANALSMLIGGTIGAILAFNYFLVFITASLFSLAGLFIALTAIPELAIVPPVYVRMYSRILYMTSITSYNFMVFTTREAAKTVLKLIAFILAFILLFIIYRTIYYLQILTGGP